MEKRQLHSSQLQQSQQPLNIITNTINSRPSLLRKPTTTSTTSNDRISYPPSSDSKFIQQQPLLTNADIKLEDIENSSGNSGNNILKNSINNVSMQISQLNSSHHSRALLMQKRNNPTTNIRPTVKKKLDDTHKPLASNFKKPVAPISKLNNTSMNNNNNKINNFNNTNNTNNINSKNDISPTQNTTKTFSPNSSLLNSSIKFEKSNFFSTMYSSPTTTTTSSTIINENNNNISMSSNNSSFDLQQQHALHERMNKIDQFTQTVRGNLQTQFDNISEQLKPPRLSLSIQDIKTRLDYEEKNKEVEKVKLELKNVLQSFKEKEKELMEAHYKVSQLSLIKDNMERDLQQSNQTILDLQHEIRSSSLKAIEVDEKFHNMTSVTKDLDDEIIRLNQLVNQRDVEIESLKKDNRDLLEKSRADEKLRRKLHNTIQELKGNIRVFCRIRPDFSSPDGLNGNVFNLPPGTDNLVEVKSPTIGSFNGEASIKKTAFTFDRVFGPASTQEMVFEDISQLVQSSLDGYNTCIFTYGQTGSGKTHSILGDLKVPSQRGMIPRTVEKIFSSIQELSEKGWTYQIECFFLEIYNETINDLLNTTSKNNNNDLKYEIKHNLENNVTTVTNMTVVPVTNPKQVYELLALANKTRSVAKTLCNERSSRSHTVFQLKLTGFNQQSSERTQGLLNLIDLAGSERVSRSGVEGKQLKETQAINKSLSSLGDVISALANKEQHIPYRNSKLTFLLQNSIGGNSKTLMFVNISPELKDLQESTSSLRFAAKVNSCELGVARKQKII
ncbi:hypothetical protein RB653_007881 [Dictyostelium firmibasis]|uniref:Kinesin motor domain-containing protein n=1 Tax=Dictyostelium firmibasis TaxID=79012 RepID=A0AAN7TMJ2_9MYCE